MSTKDDAQKVPNQNSLLKIHSYFFFRQGLVIVQKVAILLHMIYHFKNGWLHHGYSSLYSMRPHGLVSI